MNFSEIEKDIRRFLQREFYLENNSDDKTRRMQDAAARFAYEKYPDLKKCVITVDYFNELHIDLG